MFIRRLHSPSAQEVLGTAGEAVEDVRRRLHLGDDAHRLPAYSAIALMRPRTARCGAIPAGSAWSASH